MSTGPRATRGELQTRAIRGATWTLVHTMVALVIGFFVNILLARVLGVEDFGRLAYLTLVITIAGQIAELGLAGGVIQFGAKAHAEGDSVKVASLLRKSQGFRLLTFAPVVTLAVLAIVRVEPVMLVLALGVGVWMKAALAGALLSLTIENKTDRMAKNAILVNAITQGSVVAVLLFLGDADSVWATRIVVGTLGVALALPYINRSYRRAVLKPALPRKLPSGFWRYAIPAGIAGIVGRVLISRTEVLFLTWWDMTTAAGLYAAAFGLAAHVFSPAQALVGPLIPAISGLRQVDSASVAVALRRTLRASSVAVAILVSTFVAPLGLLIPLIYGSSYANAAPAFVALALGAGLATVGGPLFAFVQARLAGSRLLYINLVSLAVNLILVVTLLPLFNLWGAVIASLTATGVRVVLLFVGEVRNLKQPFRGPLSDITPLVIGGVGTVVAFTLGSALPLGALGSAGVAGICGLFIFIAAVRLSRTGLTPDDARVLRSSLPKVFRGPAAAFLSVVQRRV